MCVCDAHVCDYYDKGDDKKKKTRGKGQHRTEQLEQGLVELGRVLFAFPYVGCEELVVDDAFVQ